MAVDVHKLTAALLLDKKPEEITNEERQWAKLMRFYVSYGGETKTQRSVIDQPTYDELLLSEDGINATQVQIDRVVLIHQLMDQMYNAGQADLHATPSAPSYVGVAQQLLSDCIACWRNYESSGTMEYRATQFGLATKHHDALLVLVAGMQVRLTDLMTALHALAGQDDLTPWIGAKPE